MVTRDFFSKGFFGNKHFDMEDRQKFIEEWEKMPDNEKLEIINKRIKAFKEGKECDNNRFSVEHIDAHCEEWMSKTPEEKALFVENLKKKFEKRHSMMKEHLFHHGFEFGFGFRGRGQNQEESADRQ